MGQVVDIFEVTVLLIPVRAVKPVDESNHPLYFIARLRMTATHGQL